MRAGFGPFLIALAILALPFVDRGARLAIGPDQPAQSGADVDALRTELTIARREIDELKTRLEQVREEGYARDEEMSRLLGDRAAPEEAPVGEGDQFAREMRLTARRSVNVGVSPTPESLFLQTFGPPREEIGEGCQEPTNTVLMANIATEDVGPVRATMLRPALDSLRSVFDAVREYEPVLYKKISSAGSLCVRRIRDSDAAISTHAWGASIDLNIDGHLDTLGDGVTQFGLILLAEFFNEAGWYWGASFPREDSMHFEVGEDLMREWIRDGAFVIN